MEGISGKIWTAFGIYRVGFENWGTLDSQFTEFQLSFSAFDR